MTGVMIIGERCHFL